MFMSEVTAGIRDTMFVLLKTSQPWFLKPPCAVILKDEAECSYF